MPHERYPLPSDGFSGHHSPRLVGLLTTAAIGLMCDEKLIRNSMWMWQAVYLNKHSGIRTQARPGQVSRVRTIPQSIPNTQYPILVAYGDTNTQYRYRYHVWRHQINVSVPQVSNLFSQQHCNGIIIIKIKIIEDNVYGAVIMTDPLQEFTWFS